MTSKDEAARELIDWHFQIEPEIKEVYRFTTPDEADPLEPIKLLEVSEATMASGSVVPFGFGKTEETPYPTVIATVTPEEMEQIRRQQISLPSGWSLESAQRFSRLAEAPGGNSDKEVLAVGTDR